MCGIIFKYKVYVFILIQRKSLSTFQALVSNIHIQTDSVWEQGVKMDNFPL